MDFNSNETKIQKFYSGKNILITGGTGFLGKILLDKLLRTCDVNTIYLIIRPKKGKHVHSRCEELFEDILFERLKKEVPKFRHKVQAIAGDCSLPDLGMSSSDRKLLENEVNIVFHAAATVRFDEKLRLATGINIKGCREMLHLSKNMTKLIALIHVSTAYANCPWDHVEEKFYPPSIDYQKLLSITDNTDDKQLDQLTKSIIKDWPNTYTFTKALAEDLVRRESDNLPIGVFRPSIVTSTYREPVKAWVDNMYGATGVCAGAGAGILRTLHCDPSAIANITPVDTTVNAMICTAWDTAVKYGTYPDDKKPIEITEEKSDDITVYNYVSTSDNSMSWSKFMSLCEKTGVRVPSIKAVWYYSLTLNKYWLIHWLYVIFLHLLPGLLVDTVLVCLRKQPRMLKIYKNIIKYNSVISYFCLHTWTFKYDNVLKLWDKLDKTDQELFFFDMRQVNWEDYFKEHMWGVRKYLLKDHEQTLPAAKVKWRLFYWMHHLGKYAILYFFLRFVWYVLTNVLYD